MIRGMAIALGVVLLLGGIMAYGEGAPVVVTAVWIPLGVILIGLAWTAWGSSARVARTGLRPPGSWSSATGKPMQSPDHIAPHDDSKACVKCGSSDNVDERQFWASVEHRMLSYTSRRGGVYRRVTHSSWKGAQNLTAPVCARCARYRWRKCLALFLIFIFAAIQVVIAAKADSEDLAAGPALVACVAFFALGIEFFLAMWEDGGAEVAICCLKSTLKERGFKYFGAGHLEEEPADQKRDDW